MSDLELRFELAKTIAQRAGDHTLTYFQRDDLQVERKKDKSPVTVADREAEQILRQEIARVFPDDGVIGEEFGEQSGTSGYRWILDPIDGTKSFICGVPLYGTLVGVERDGESLIGVIHIPALRETVYAAQGLGAWYVKADHSPRAARVSSRRKLSDGVFMTSQLDLFAQRGAADAFHRLAAAANITRMWGDCYGYLLVATGRAEAMVDAEMHIWDAAALQPILEEAGGKFTDWQGRRTIYGGEAVATNGYVAEEVLAVTRSFPKPE